MTTTRTVFITGCSDGSLGSALALALHELGWRVFASARDLAKLKDVKAAGIECLEMNVSSDESVLAGVEKVKRLTGGSLDCLINNAGGGYSMPVIHLDLDRTRDLFELNVISVIRVTNFFVPLLLRSTKDPLLVNNTSGVALLGCGVPFQGAYNASKAAAASLTESLRIELAPFGIRVINLLTGGVQSTFFQNSNDAKLPLGSIYDLAKEAIEAPMNGVQPGMEKVDAATWAKQVVKDLNQPKPPHLVFRGTKAGTARIAALLPLGTGDGILKKMSGLDVLEKKIHERGGTAMLRSPSVSQTPAIQK